VAKLDDATPYTVGGVAFSIGKPAKVQAPPLVFRARLTGMHFETDKTLLLPSAMRGIKHLKQLYDEHPGMQVLISGHTDTVGTANYNVGLSNQRATSIAAFLQDDVDGWMAFYKGQPNCAAWGTREDQIMLNFLPDPDAPFYTDTIDGIAGDNTVDAVKAFQTFSNDNRGTSLDVDGKCGDQTRRALVTEYMRQDGTTLPDGTVLKKHGCGFFHPAVPTPPNTDSLENRRVEIFFFQDGITPPPQDPCPSPGCPEYPQWLAQSVLTIDLDADPPPAPVATKTLEIRIVNNQDEPVAGAKYRLDVGSAKFENETDSDGVLTEKIPADATQGLLAFAQWSVTLDIRNLDDAPASHKARLNNLGLAAGPQDDDTLGPQAVRAIQRFQEANGLAPKDGSPPSGALDDATKKKLKDTHGS
jgi:outer membrane protein OmpA-like peptidoglycan-associated protein